MTYSHKVYETIYRLTCNFAKIFLYIDLTKFFTGRLNNKFVLRLLKIPLHLKCVAMLPCDLSLITTLVSDCCLFSASTVSQGSLLMHIKCGEMFNSAANLLQNLPVKKFENQLRTGGVKVTRLVSPFLVHGIRNIILILMLPQLSCEVGYV